MENWWLYLPIDGEKTEKRRSDFKVLRPLKPEEKNRQLRIRELEERATYAAHQLNVRTSPF